MPIIMKGLQKIDNSIKVCGIWGIKNKQNENPNHLDPGDIDPCV